MAARGQPFFTENFTTNLDSIELFLDREGRPAFRRLLARIFDEVLPIILNDALCDLTIFCKA